MNPPFFSFLSAGPPIDPATAAEGCASGALVLVDVREGSEFRRSRAPGARHIPLDELGGRLEELAASGKPVAFVCRSGRRSALAARQARRAGIETHNVKGGMLAWERSGLPIEAAGRG